MLRRTLLLAGGAGAVSGCTTLGSYQPSGFVDFESLARQMKHDVGKYVFNNQDRVNPAGGAVCAGDVAFSIYSVTMTVTAVVDRSQGASGGLKIPLNLLTISPKITAARSFTDTLTTSLTVYPLIAAKDAIYERPELKRQRLTSVPPPSPKFEGTPINDTLEKLRADLVKTSDTAPCFKFGEPDKQKNSIKWAFSVVDKTGGGVSFDIAIVSIGAEGAQQRTYANTLEVAFTAAGEGFG